jgi:hypothetical protein
MIEFELLFCISFVVIRPPRPVPLIFWFLLSEKISLADGVIYVPDSIRFLMSRSIILPCGPVPFTSSYSNPFFKAKFFALGEILKIFSLSLF